MVHDVTILFCRSNTESLREFIKAIYVERRYAGVSLSERPPRDIQVQLVKFSASVV